MAKWTAYAVVGFILMLSNPPLWFLVPVVLWWFDWEMRRRRDARALRAAMEATLRDL